MFIILLVIAVPFFICWAAFYDEAARQMGWRSGVCGNGTRTVGGKNAMNPTTGMGFFKAHRWIKRNHKKAAKEQSGWFVVNCQCPTCVKNQRAALRKLNPSESDLRAARANEKLSLTKEQRQGTRALFTQDKARRALLKQEQQAGASERELSKLELWTIRTNERTALIKEQRTAR